MRVHSRLAIRTILIAVAILGAVGHVVVVIAASIVIHRAVSGVLAHLAHVVGIVGVGEVRVLVLVSGMAGHMRRSGRLSGRRKSGVRRVVATVGSIDVAITAGGLRRGDMRLHLGARNTEPSTRSLGNAGILRLTIGAVVVVRKPLVNGVEGGVFAASGDGRLNGSLIGEWLLDLRLWLRNLLAERVVRLVGVGVAREIGEGRVGGGDLRNGREPRSWARDSRAAGRSLGLGRRRQGSTRGHGGVLRGLSTGFGVFAVLVDVNVGRVAVQAHAAELHGSPVNGVVCGHNNCFLLFHHATLGARSSDAVSQ